MKKNLLFAAAALVALAACTKESPVKEEGAIDASKLVFNIDVRSGSATKGVKTAWENGDDVYVFFEDNTTQYVKMTYDGTSWSYKDNANGTAFTNLNLEASGKKLSAVYMPDFVCTAAPTWSTGKWTFGSIAGYYQKAEGVEYTVTSADNVNTLSAVISLTAPSNIMQFYVPADQCAAPGAGNEYVLTATHVINYTFNGIAPGGVASQGNKLNGGAMKGYSATIGGETGYYFWGILESAGSYKFDCQLVKQNAEKKYAISSYFVSKDLRAHSFSSAAIKLTGLTDKGNFVDLGFGDCLWATGNLGRPYPSAPISTTNYQIESPLEAGDYFQWGAKVVYNTSTYNDQWTGTTYEDSLLPKAQDVAYQVNNAWRIPSMAQLDALYDSENTNATTYSQSWKEGWTSLGPTKGGMLLTSKKNGISLFLAAAGYYDAGSLDYEGDYVYFWSSTPRDTNYAYLLYFGDEDIKSSYSSRHFGYSVRPVQNKVTP